MRTLLHANGVDIEPAPLSGAVRRVQWCSTSCMPIRVTAKPGRIVIEAETEPALDQMLAAFDLKRYFGEAMAGGAVGVEAFADGNS